MSRIVEYVDDKDATAGSADDPRSMLKEIHQQPGVIEATLQGLVDLGRPDGLSVYGVLSEGKLAAIRRVVLLGCGTSWHSALVGKFMLETLCRLPVEVEVASEFRYRCLTLDLPMLAVAISQSGETVDMLGAARAARASGATLVAISNARGSSLSREADGVLYTRSGPEIGVAATTAFGAQLAALAVLAIRIGRAQGSLSAAQARRLIQELVEIPRLVTRALAAEPLVVAIARRLRHRENFLYLARGINVPVALEGALRLKEIADVHAEGHPAGEMAHGLITLIDDTVPVVVIVPKGRLHDKLIGCIDDVKARHGVVIALATEGDLDIAGKTGHVVYCPSVPELFEPLVFSVAVQLLACHIALFRERDVEQANNSRRT